MTEPGARTGALVGRRAVITGAASGIGAAIAEAFAREGAVLCLADRAQLDRFADVLSRTRALTDVMDPITADVSAEADVSRLFAIVQDQLGGVDVLVNNAGILTSSNVEDMGTALFDEMLATNLRSVFLCCRAVVPIMTAQRFGRIINMSSQLALKGKPGLAHYSAAKAGIIGFSRALAHEVGGDGITVNCIAPGPIDTPLNAHVPADELARLSASLPLGRMGRAEEVAPTAVLLASSPAGDLYTGQTLGPNSGDVMP